MKKNLGSADITTRVAIAVIIALLYFTSSISGVVGIILLVVGAILLLTAVVGFCPLYSIFGINSCRRKS